MTSVNGIICREFRTECDCVATGGLMGGLVVVIAFFV